MNQATDFDLYLPAHYLTLLIKTFLQLISKHCKDHELANNPWLEIFTKYSKPKRHYHTIDHLEALGIDLKEVKDQIIDWNTTLFSVFYQNIILQSIK